MPQSLDHILIHVVFSTFERRTVLNSPVREGLHGYIATVVRSHDCECPRVGGTADHVHLAIRLARTVTVAKVVEDVKVRSSKWLKAQSPELRDFAWQKGYGAFSVGPSDLDALVAYIDDQEAHHLTRTFQEEYLAFLKKYDIPYDTRWVWE